MYTAKYLSPMVPSYNLAETGLFFKNILGFSPVMEKGTYAVFQKDHLTVHILPAGEAVGQMEFYLEVDDVDKIWVSIENKIQGLKYRAPFDQEYGMRELHIEIPCTNTLLFIGHPIG